MDALWIIIFVGAMIFKAVNKGQQTGKENGWGKGKDWTKGKDWGKWEEWGKWDEPEFPPVFNEGRENPLPQKDGRTEAEFEPAKRLSMMPEREQIETQRSDLTSQRKREADLTTGFLEINQNTLVNAVIMSEILQPPVSKRKQKNRF